MITILHEDPDLLAVFKPPGAVVIPARDEAADDSLRHTLQRTRHEALWVVHRLDRDTTGVLLFARNAAAHRTLNALFLEHRVRKTYLALTRGVPSVKGGVIDVPLHTARKGKMRPALAGEAGAMASRTAVTVLAQRTTPLGSVALVRAMPETGRQHQIRVHLRWAGAPLLVDPLYGGARQVAPGALGEGLGGLARLTLHAAALELPWRGSALCVRAPFAEDLAGVARGLFGTSLPQDL